MADRTAIFEAILQKNVLRRKAHLPLLPVRSTYIAEVEKKLWIEYTRQNSAQDQAERMRRPT